MTVMRNRHRVLLFTSPGIVLMLQAMCAYASGREGEAYVDAVSWIVAIVLLAFAALVFGGGLLGASRARKSDESILKGLTLGLMKGAGAFLMVGIVTVVVLTILSILWVAYALLDVHVLNAS